MELKQANAQNQHLKDPTAGGGWCSFFYGPNNGLAQQHAHNIAKTLGAADIITWGKSQWRDEADQLPSLLASPSLFGDKQCYIVLEATDSYASTLTTLAAMAPFEHYLVVVGGELPKASKLRAWGAAQAGVGMIACYEETAQSFLQRVLVQAQEKGLTLPRDAAQIVATNLDGNIAAIAPALEKLALYVHPHTHISAEAASACVANQIEEVFDGIVASTFARDRHLLVQQLPRFWQSDESAVGLLRVAQNHAHRLLKTLAHMAAGDSARVAMDKLRPKVFYKNEDAFLRQLNIWTTPKLLAFLDKLHQAEFECKQTGAADTLVAERTLISG